MSGPGVTDGDVAVNGRSTTVQQAERDTQSSTIAGTDHGNGAAIRLCEVCHRPTKPLYRQYMAQCDCTFREPAITASEIIARAIAPLMPVAMQSVAEPAPAEVYPAGNAEPKTVDLNAMQSESGPELVNVIIPEGIGDINSVMKGSGARFNAGKAPLHLIPANLIGGCVAVVCPDASAPLCRVFEYLGAWQAGGGVETLWAAVAELGKVDDIPMLQLWEECAAVFDYGRKKYAEWNWAKGMVWSVPFACITRHLFAMMRGEVLDGESNLPHRGHIMCNIVMLAQYATTYTEGDDRPGALLK